jgi:hypothetical protein
MSDTNGFQALATKQGGDFERLVQATLSFRGWTVIDTQHVVHGASIDIVASDPDGRVYLIECKGANGSSKRPPGLKDGTTVKVAIGVAYYLQSCGIVDPYVIATSHMPTPGSLPDMMLSRCLNDGAIADVWEI